MRSKRSIGWVVLLAVGLTAFLYGVLAEGPALTASDRAQRLGELYACETCNGQSIAESNAPFAVQARRDILRRVTDGETDQEIKEFLVDRYGEDIDLTPRGTGLVGLVWVLPIAVSIAGIFGLAAFFATHRGGDPATASDADRKLVDEARQ